MIILPKLLYEEDLYADDSADPLRRIINVSCKVYLHYIHYGTVMYSILSTI